MNEPATIDYVPVDIGKDGKQYPITVKQRKFADLVATGMSNADAYRQTYDCTDMTDASIYRKAYDLARNPKVTARLSQLSAPLAAIAVCSAEKVLTSLERVASKAETAEEYSAATRALELLGKYHRLFVDQLAVNVVNVPTTIDVNEAAQSYRDLLG